MPTFSKRNNQIYDYIKFLALFFIGFSIILILFKFGLIENAFRLSKYFDEPIPSSNQHPPNHQGDVIVHLSLLSNETAIRGKIIAEQNVELAQFLGIRYAQTPKRFRRSKPLSAPTGTVDALEWPPLCMQNRLVQYEYLTKIYNYNMSEDCLYLNIWSPLHAVRMANERPVETEKNGGPLPVIIYIHGGSFSYMGISMEAYYGGIISALGNVVLVTINYRLGVFGFFDNQLEDDDSMEYFKNLGLYDQITAIEWVKRNINHFGGDPERITLQGQSAGAISIGLLMLSKESGHLFKRAILQSASPMMLKQIYSSDHYSKVIELANCTDAQLSPNFLADGFDDDPMDLPAIEENNYGEDVDYGESDNYEPIDLPLRIAQTKCLESLSADKLNQIQGEMLKNSTIIFSPSIPSKLLPEFVDEDSARDFVQQEILIGANSNESTLFLHHELPDLLPLNATGMNLTKDDWKMIFQKLQFDSRNLDQINRMIFNILESQQNKNDWNANVVAFLNDLMFKGPVFKFAKLFSKNRTAYLYSFMERTEHYPEWIGAGHWNEMDFVFGIPLLHPERFTQQQQQLSIRMIKSWTHFATTGKPLPQNSIEWPRLDAKNLHMNLRSDRIEIGHDLDMKFYHIFDLIYDST